jgi:PAS domain S-box-containing protein
MDKGQQQTEASSPILSLHIANSPLAVIEWDNQFRVKQWSVRAEQVFGWQAEDVIGKYAHEIGYIHVDDWPQVSTIIKKLMSGQQNRSINRNRNYHKNGSVIYCEWYESVLFDENGKLISIWSLVQDITEQVEAEMALRQLNAELEERVTERTKQLKAANKELESFAYAVSHDLRAPLRAIVGFSEALAGDYAKVLDSKGLHFLQRIQAGGQRMSQLIDDLLTLSRITSQELIKKPVNMSELAIQITAEFQQTAPQRNVQISITPHLIVQSNHELLAIALRNLIGNAWKFSSLQPIAQIELEVMEKDGEQIYFIRDNGAGFDMRYAGKLFDPFQRLHRRDEFPGTGIGLATVQRIIHKHDGRIWAKSAIGNGATFYFTLK